MKRIAISTLLLAGIQVGAQQQSSPTNIAQSTPVTKVLAMGHLTATATPGRLLAVMQSEVKATVDLYLSGKIEQWYSRKDQNGVVFVLNVTSIDEARNLLEALPLGQEKLMEFDLIPLGPLAPLRVLNGSASIAPQPAK